MVLGQFPFKIISDIFRPSFKMDDVTKTEISHI